MAKVTVSSDHILTGVGLRSCSRRFPEMVEQLIEDSLDLRCPATKNTSKNKHTVPTGTKPNLQLMITHLILFWQKIVGVCLQLVEVGLKVHDPDGTAGDRETFNNRHHHNCTSKIENIWMSHLKVLLLLRNKEKKQLKPNSANIVFVINKISHNFLPFDTQLGSCTHSVPPLTHSENWPFLAPEANSNRWLAGAAGLKPSPHLPVSLCCVPVTDSFRTDTHTLSTLRLQTNRAVITTTTATRNSPALMPPMTPFRLSAAQFPGCFY